MFCLVYSFDEYIRALKKNYSNELYFKNIDLKYEKWLENVSLETEKRVLEKLFFNLKFYSKIELKEILKKKLEEIMSKYDGLKDAAIIPLTPTEGRYSGANELIGLIKEIDREENLNGNTFIPYKDTILNDIIYSKSMNTLILVDDISGTGGTVKKFIQENRDYLNGKNIVLLFVGVTTVALSKIEADLQCEAFETTEIYYGEEFEKLSTNKVLTQTEYELLHKIESNLWNKNTFILGYMQSELLIVFSHNTPNNTISSVWFESEYNPCWNSLFKRITLPNKKRQNYSNKKGV